MAAWRFTICCHPKSRWPPSEHMHQSPEIRDWRNTAEVSIRGSADPGAGNRQVTRKKEHGEPAVTPPSTQPRSRGTAPGEPRTALNCAAALLRVALALTRKSSHAADICFPSSPSFSGILPPLPLLPCPASQYWLFFPVSALSGHSTEHTCAFYLLEQLLTLIKTNTSIHLLTKIWL